MRNFIAWNLIFNVRVYIGRKIPFKKILTLKSLAHHSQISVKTLVRASNHLSGVHLTMTFRLRCVMYVCVRSVVFSISRYCETTCARRWVRLFTLGCSTFLWLPGRTGVIFQTSKFVCRTATEPRSCMSCRLCLPRLLSNDTEFTHFSSTRFSL